MFLVSGFAPSLCLSSDEPRSHQAGTDKAYFWLISSYPVHRIEEAALVHLLILPLSKSRGQHDGTRSTKSRDGIIHLLSLTKSFILVVSLARNEAHTRTHTTHTYTG